MPSNLAARLRAIKYIQVAKDLTHAAISTWNGSPMEKFDAFLGVASGLVTVDPDNMAWMFRTYGFEGYHGSLHKYLFALNFRDEVSGPFGNLSFFPDSRDPLVILHKYGDHHGEGILVKVGADLRAAIRDSVWGGRPAIRLVNAGSSAWSHETVRIVEATPPGPYWGVPSVESVVDLVRRSGGSEGTRSILIVGESGLGKSTMARRVADAIYDDGILIVPNDAVVNFINNVDAVSTIRPNAIILEDVPLAQSVTLLSFYESLRGTVPLLISTFMASRRDAAKTGPGADYWPGMRPGRVDQIIRLYPPDALQVCEILRGYLGSEPEEAMVSAATAARFGGAHLRELSNRVRSGLAWPGEVENLVRMMEQGDDAAQTIAASEEEALLGDLEEWTEG